MADPKGRGAMGFIIGALVVIVAGLVWYIYADGDMPGQDKAEIKINLPDGN
ncbi:hypothetical protein SAMN05216224_103177 [Thioclava dalianensis]|uniref:hypothetical protein n=1 Tax=Thioclava dalianensis TaxID=1185766 RepID=UPI0008F655B9|nr:hypothetical protein [Thioclava dalianensis]SFN25084.1 hypothetical protein SAMN05216224_103177 [Thioclava dalianensis]